MAALAYTAIPSTGIPLASSLVVADVSLTDTFPADTSKLFIVANGDVSPHTVTITPPVASTICGTFGSVDLEPRVITVPAGESQLFTIPSGYSDAQLFTLVYDDVTMVTIGGFSLAPNL